MAAMGANQRSREQVSYVRFPPFAGISCIHRCDNQRPVLFLFRFQIYYLNCECRRALSTHQAGTRLPAVR